MDVVVVACAVLLDVNACSGPCHPTTPTTYLYSTSIEDSRCWLRATNTLTYGYSKNTHPTREACEASTNSSTIVHWTHLITCCNARTIMYSENIFFPRRSTHSENRLESHS